MSRFNRAASYTYLGQTVKRFAPIEPHNCSPPPLHQNAQLNKQKIIPFKHPQYFTQNTASTFVQEFTKLYYEQKTNPPDLNGLRPLTLRSIRPPLQCRALPYRSSQSEWGLLVIAGECV